MTMDKLNKIGWLTYIPFLILTLRLTWEKIFLTWTYGPQNIGFSLAHGYGAFLLLALPINLIWTIIMVIAFLFRDKQNEGRKRRWNLLVIAISTWLVLFIPFDSLVLILKPDK